VKQLGKIVNKKFENLLRQLNVYLQDGVIIAFSGGVDSAMLLWAAKKIQDEAGGKLLALTTDSPSLPRSELDQAITFAKQLDVAHEITQSAEMSLKEYIRNDSERCYHCKKELFRITDALANRQGYKWIVYGYNGSDHQDYRPGHKAAQESAVISPLADAGLSKDDIRHILSVNGIEFADKPASPCLSSRIMTGIPITEKRLKDIEEMEKILYASGIKIGRVRVCLDQDLEFLRIEVSEPELPVVLNIRRQLVDQGMQLGYRWVTLDLDGYRMGGGVK